MNTALVMLFTSAIFSNTFVIPESNGNSLSPNFFKLIFEENLDPIFAMSGGLNPENPLNPLNPLNIDISVNLLIT